VSAEPLNMAKREIQRLNRDYPGRSQSWLIPSGRCLSEMETVELLVAHGSVLG
jgi:hypothetical protein